MINLYWYIKTHYQGREREALDYLWGLVPFVRRQDEAASELAAIERNFEIDEQINRAKRGMSNG